MFRLLRYYSLTSLISIAIVTALLAFFHRQIALSDLMETGERHNVALTRALANSLWPQFGAFLTSTTELSDDALRNHPDIGKIRESLVQAVNGLSVLKIKIYDVNGRTVFSSEAEQIGENKSKNAGFLSARSGAAASEFTHRDSFSAFEGVVENRDLISSHVPVWSEGAGGRIEGVFELYNDVSDLLVKTKQTGIKLIAGVVLLLALLYGVLYFIVRHAERVMKSQGEERTAAEKALALANQRLEKTLAEMSSLYAVMTPLAVSGSVKDILDGVIDKLISATARMPHWFGCGIRVRRSSLSRRKGAFRSPSSKRQSSKARAPRSIGRFAAARRLSPRISPPTIVSKAQRSSMPGISPAPFCRSKCALKSAASFTWRRGISATSLRSKRAG